MALESSNSTQAMDLKYYNWCIDYPTMPIVWSATSVISFLLGFPASLWVLHELIQRQRKRSTSDIFMLSLAVLDLAFTAQIPLSICNFMLWRIEELELIIDFIYSLNLFGRPLFMACICWDCYVAVVHPIVYKTSTKLIILKKAITITICFTTFVAAFVLCTIQWLTTTPFVAIPLIVALPVISFCDISILQALRKPDPTGNNNIHPQKKQALHTISNSFIMTFVVYLPPMIMFTFGKLTPLTDTNRYCYLSMSGFCFSTFGCVIMPVLYLISIGKLDTFRNWWYR